MKHSDDQINERLGWALKQKLTGTADQPDPLLARKILSAAGGRRHAGLWAKALMLLICGILSITPLAHRKQAGGVLFTRLKPHHKTARTGESPVLNENQAIGVAAAHVKVRPAIQRRLNVNSGNTLGLGHDGVLSSTLKGITTKNAAMTGNQLSLMSENMTADDMFVSLPDSVLISENRPSSGLDLEMLTPRNGTFSTSTAVTVEIPGNNASTSKPAQTSRPWNILLGVSPMNTFQMIDIKPNQQVAYQNFRFAPVLSGKKMAYKFQAGIEQNGWQLQATYIHFLQTFYYEITTDEYMIKQGGSSQDVVRKGVGTEEHQALNMLGIGLSKDIFLGSHSSTRFLARLGLEYSHDFGARQSVTWGTLMIGRQITLNRKNSLVLGPHFTYGLSKLNAALGRFNVQPYQVGVAVILHTHVGKQ